MTKINAVMIDSREPEWVQKIDFGAPTLISAMETGDVQVITEDGYTLLIERKTPDDFLNSLREGRLFEQMRRLALPRLEAQLRGETARILPYLVISGIFSPGADGKVYTSRPTGWTFESVTGSLLSIQEAGVYPVFCNGDGDFRACILRLANRSREDVLNILPPRPIEVLGPKEAFLAALPGIGIERAKAALEWGGWNLAVTLMGVSDPTIAGGPLPPRVRENIRVLFGLKEGEELTISAK